MGRRLNFCQLWEIIMKYHLSFGMVACFLILQVSGVNAQSPVSGYHLLKKVALGGEGGWDFLSLDSRSRHLFISRATHVMVIDVDSGKSVGDIPNTAGVHGIALVPEIGKGFTSNGKDSTVTVFDLDTLKALKQIPVGKNPDAIIYDPASKRIFTFNGGSNNATVIDAQNRTVEATISLEGRPEFAVVDELGYLYITLEDKSQVVVLDSNTLTIKSRWPLAPGKEPTGIAMDREHKRLFIGCANKLMVIMDSGNGAIIATLPIGGGVDATAFDPESSLVFSSNRDGTLTVIKEDSPNQFSVLDNVATQKGARTMVLDPKTHHIFLVTAEFGPTPEPTKDQPRPRPSIMPGSFVLLEMGK